MTFEEALRELKRGKMIRRSGSPWIWLGSSGQCYYGNKRNYPMHFCDSLLMKQILASDWEVEDAGVHDYSSIRAVCSDCAKAAGFMPKDKVVGGWMDDCGICHKWKTCTDLWHDWKKDPNHTKER